MSLIIDASNSAARLYLTVDSSGVNYCNDADPNPARAFRFQDIDCVLLSPDSLLSFQVGAEVFKLPADPNNQNHQQTIATLVYELQLANGMAAPE